MSTKQLIKPYHARIFWSYKWGSVPVMLSEYVNFDDKTLEPESVIYGKYQSAEDWRRSEIYRHLLENREKFVTLPDPSHYRDKQQGE